MYASGTLLAGLTMLIFPLTDTFITMALVAALYGVWFSQMIALQVSDTHFAGLLKFIVLISLKKTLF